MDARFIGGGKNVTQVSDSFSTAGGRNTLNPVNQILWEPTPILQVPYNSPNVLALMQIGAQAGGGSGLNMTCLGQNNNVYTIGVIMPCLGFTFGMVNGKTQFSQFTFNANTGANCVCCLGVMITSDPNSSNFSMYAIEFNGNGVVGLGKIVLTGNVITNTGLGNPPGASMTQGNVFRISCQVGVGSNVITVQQNGVQLSQVTDNGSVGGPALTGGVPGMYNFIQGVSAGVTTFMQFRNWSGGLGL